MKLTETIAAISTAPGEGGISVIRLSGEKAFSVAEKFFFRDKERKNQIEISETNSHTVHFGYIFDNEDLKGQLIDEVLITIFKNPHSYTGEDVIEISCHGGAFIAQKILRLLLKNNVRHAEPGEFTKRAFLNGKMDLSQAEAVADLISSKTESAHSSSIKQLEGSLSEFVYETRQDIINIVSLVELELDFAEEGLEFVKKEEILNMINSLNERLRNIIASYITGRVIREGVNLVIAGKPNSGKSSLFNYFLKTNRAIVSNIAGTTRDYIEESIIINGVLFNLIDTAGLRHSIDEIESEGIKRSHKKIEEADLIIYLIDSSDTKKEIKKETEHFNKDYKKENTILAFSKSDLSKESSGENGISISLLRDETIEELKKEMISKVTSGNISHTSEDIILTNLRHRICLENVVKSLDEASGTVKEGMSGEFISVDLRNALNHLGEITGEVTN
ncbi:MAG TPA: tRNA uridine-5-carboxymethylaminomethyl(34) synthesis GTPase MnmE, partial [Ignavibacteria bacterium]|nr:tRNA uridine-5-carboxymethylaminomethyl(34) synthesis GTPase MnmE [Ignavibacteria bacterium]